MAIPLPNLFVLGAGKCGTTTLHNLLSLHPSIVMSKPKEPSFWCRSFQVVKNPMEYFSLFSVRNGATAIYRGESSHVYFSNPETAEVIAALFPDAKFIVILRDPMQRAYSLYRHMRRGNHESIPTFHEALVKEDERLAGDHSVLPR